MAGVICQWCSKISSEIIHLTGDPSQKTQTVCYECFNQDVASSAGIELDYIRIKVISARGFQGMARQFNISRIIYPMGICLEANEITNDGSDGYKISVHGELDCDQKELFKKLTRR